MRLVRPITITTATLTDANVAEAVPAAYAGGTTYALGDRVSVAGTLGAYTVYESLAGSNTGHTPASSPTWWVAKGTVYAAYNGGTTYAAEYIVTDTTNHKLYKSLAGSNTGHALTDTDWWLEISASNKWAAFDNATGALTEWEGEIVYEITTTGVADVVALLNMDGITTANLVAVADSVEVLDADYDLISGGGINNWWDYFFEPYGTQADLAITDLINLEIDPEAELVLTLTLTGSGPISIGEIVVGRSRVLGATQYGLSLGIVDYSKIEVDVFGVRAIVQRNFAKRLSGEIWVDSANTSYVFSLLAALRATPVLVIGADDYAASIQFGLLKSWSERIAYPSHSILDLEFEGL